MAVMSDYEDGFKRGTNYNRRLAHANYDPHAELTLGRALRAACGRGEHDETAAERGRVTFIGMGRRAEPGTRYCRRCGETLPGGRGDPVNTPTDAAGATPPLFTAPRPPQASLNGHGGAS